MLDCNRCGLMLDESCFSPRKTRKRGFYYACKQCINNRNKSKSYVPQVNGTKVCSKCKIEKPLTSFEAERKRPSGRGSHCKGCRSKYKLHRYHTNINHKVSENVRRRVRSVLVGLNKSDLTFELIGCDVEHLKSYLESKFTEGMDWDNYGSCWHIDHIRPCSSFDLSDPSQQKLCFNYMNLQPLWAKDNLIKGDKYDN